MTQPTQHINIDNLFITQSLRLLRWEEELQQQEGELRGFHAKLKLKEAFLDQREKDLLVF